MAERSPPAKIPKFVTIGVYGFSQDEFFRSLQEAQVDTFCDIRARRGMRGRTYAFVNSTKLQNRLASMGIRYLHIKELAPTPEVRDVQRQADAASGTSKRQRAVLGRQFVDAYRASVLHEFDWNSLFGRLPAADCEVVALFCVERAPRACHRSLVADQLTERFGAAVEHLP